MDWKTGMVVRLKSGGPKMTVVGLDGERVLCEWFSRDLEPLDRDYPAEALEEVLVKEVVFESVGLIGRSAGFGKAIDRL